MSLVRKILVKEKLLQSLQTREPEVVYWKGWDTKGFKLELKGEEQVGSLKDLALQDTENEGRAISWECGRGQV